MIFEATFSDHFATDSPEVFRRHLLEHYLPFDGLRANLVISPTGSTVDENGSSRGLSSHEDHQLLLALRSISDVVLVSARTAEAEGYGASKLTSLAIIQGSGNLGEIPAVTEYTQGSRPVYVVCHVTQVQNNEHLLSNPNLKLLGLLGGSPGNLDPQEILEQLDARGLRRQLLEAGLRLDSAFLKLNLIARFCLSTVAKVELDAGLHEELLRKLGSASHQLVNSWRSADAIFTEWQCD